MLSKERFLSIRLGPHHSGAPENTFALVLEFESEQWVLYFLDEQHKIKGSLFLGSLEAGLAYSHAHFGVRPEEWTEDFSN
jgi:hypothetical protein